MASIDALDIQISAQVKNASDQLDILIDKLTRFRDAVDSAGKSKGIESAFSMAKNASKSASEITRSVERQTRKMSKSIEEISNQYKDLGKGFDFVGPASAAQKQIEKYANLLEKAKLKKQELEFAGKTEGKMYEKAIGDTIKYANMIDSLKGKLGSMNSKAAMPAANFSISGIGEAETSLDEYRKNVEEMKNLLSEGFKGALLDNLQTELGEIKSRFPEATEVIRDYEDAIKKAAKTGFSQSPREEIKAVESGFDRAVESVRSFNNEIDGSTDSASFEGVAQDFEDVAESAREAAGEAQSIPDSLGGIEPIRLIDDESLSLFRNTVDGIKNMFPDMSGLIDDESLEIFKNTAEGIKNIFPGLIGGIRNYSKEVRGVASAKLNEDDYKRLQSDIERVSSSLEKLREKQRDLEAVGADKNSKIWTQLQKDIESTRAALEKYEGKERAMEASGAAGDENPEWTELQNKILRAEKNLARYEARESMMRESGADKEAGQWGKVGQEIKKTEQVLAHYKSMEQSVGKSKEGKKGRKEVAVGALKSAASSLLGKFDKMPASFAHVFGKSFNTMISLAQKAFSKLKKSFSSIPGIAKKAASALSKVGLSIKNIASHAGRAVSKIMRFSKSMKDAATSGNHMGSAISIGFGKILKYAAGLVGLQKIIEGMKEGMKNLVQYSEPVNSSVSMLMSSLIQLKNALAAAFAPILTFIAPALNALIQMVVRAANVVGQFFSALTGKGYAIQAIKVNFDYAKSLSDADSSMEDVQESTDKTKKKVKELEKALSVLGFDELNQLAAANKAADQDDASEIEKPKVPDVTPPEDMFEIVPIEDKIKDFANKVKEAWKNVDFTEIGAIIGQKLKDILEKIPWDKIKVTARKLGKSLATLINGFVEVPGLGYTIGKTIAEAINTGLHFLDSFANNLHWGSVGKFIADGINGALENIEWPVALSAAAAIGKGLADMLNNILNPRTMANIGYTLAMSLNTVFTAIKNFAENFHWGDVGNAVGIGICTALETLDWALIKETASLVGAGIANFLNGALTPRLFRDIGYTIANGLNTALIFAHDFLTTFRWSDFGTNISTGINTAINTIEWGLLGETLAAGVKALADTINAITDPETGVDFEGLGGKISDAFRIMIGKIPWTDIGNALGSGFMIAWRILDGFITSMSQKDGAGLTGWAQLGIGLGQAVNGVFEKINFAEILRIITEGFRGILESITNLINEIRFDDIVENINAGLESLYNGLKWDVIGTQITAFTSAVKNAFDDLMNLDFGMAGRAIGAGIADIVRAFNQLVGNGGIDIEGIGKKISEGILGIVEEIPWDDFGNALGNYFMIKWRFFDGIVSDLSTRDNVGMTGWKKLGDALGNTINGLNDAIDFTQLAHLAKKGVNGLADAFISATETIKWDDISKNISNGLNTLIHGIDWENVGYSVGFLFSESLRALNDVIANTDWKAFGAGLMDCLNGAIKGIDWGEVGRYLSELVKGILDILIGAVNEIDWELLGSAIADLLCGIDWNGVVDKVFELLGAAFEKLGELGVYIGEAIGNAFEGIEQYFKDKIEECGGNIVLGILKGIGDAILGIGEWIVEHIFTPFINGFKSAFGIHSPSTVMAEQGGFIIAGLLEGLVGAIGSVLEWFAGLPGLIKEKFNDAREWLKEKGQNILEGLRDGWDAVKESEIGTAAQELAGYIKEKVGDARDWIKEKGSHALEGLRNAWDAAKESKIGTAAQELAGYIKAKVGDAHDWIKEKGSHALEGLRNAWDAAKESRIGTAAQELGGYIKGKVGDARDWIKERGSEALEGFRSGWDAVKESRVGDAAKQLGAYIKSKVGEAKKWIKKKGSDAIEGLREGWDAAKESNLGKAVQNIGTYIKEKVGNARKWVKEKGSEAIEGLREGWDSAKESKFGRELQNLGGYAKSKVGDATGWLRQKGSDIVGGMQNGFDGAWGTFSTVLGGIGNRIRNALPDLASIGRNMIQGLANGIRSINIPLPHIEIGWNQHQVGNMVFSTPSFGLNWYAKGGVFDSASVIGVGEAGSEAVLPLENKRTMAMLSRAITSEMDFGLGFGNSSESPFIENIALYTQKTANWCSNINDWIEKQDKTLNDLDDNVEKLLENNTSNTTILKAIQKHAEEAPAKADARIDKLSHTIVDIVTNIGGKIADIVNTGIASLKDSAQSAYENINTGIESIVSSINMGIQTLGDSISQSVQSVMDGVNSGLNLLTNTVSQSEQSLSNSVNSGFNLLNNTASQSVQTISSGVNSGLNLLTNTVSQSAQSLVNAMNSGFSQMASALSSSYRSSASSASIKTSSTKNTASSTKSTASSTTKATSTKTNAGSKTSTASKTSTKTTGANLTFGTKAAQQAQMRKNAQEAARNQIAKIEKGRQRSIESAKKSVARHVHPLDQARVLQDELKRINEDADKKIASIKKSVGLKTGGLVTSPIFAQIGEQSRKEAVLPLENKRTMAMISRAITSEMGLGFAGGGESPFWENIALYTQKTANWCGNICDVLLQQGNSIGELIGFAEKLSVCGEGMISSLNSIREQEEISTKTITDFISQTAKMILAQIANGWKVTTDLVKGSVQSLGEVARSGIESITVLIEQTAQSTTTLIEQITQTMATGFDSLSSLVPQSVQSLTDSMSSGFASVSNSVSQSMQSIPNSINSGFSQLNSSISQSTNTVSNSIQALTNTVKSGINQLNSSMSSLGNKISSMQSALAKVSTKASTGTAKKASSSTSKKSTSTTKAKTTKASTATKASTLNTNSKNQKTTTASSTKKSKKEYSEKLSAIEKNAREELAYWTNRIKTTLPRADWTVRIKQETERINKGKKSQIEKLKKVYGLKVGGLVTSPILTQIGEMSRPEAVLPLTNDRAMSMISKSIAAHMPTSGAFEKGELVDAIVEGVVMAMMNNPQNNKVPEYIQNSIYLDSDVMARSLSKAQYDRDYRFSPA